MALELKGVTWIFFDLGYTLINEDGAANGRIQQVSDALAERGVEASPQAFRQALEEATAQFHPSPVMYALEQFTTDSDIHAFVRQSGRYPKELEEPYPEAVDLLTSLAPRYKLGIIANQPAGTAARLERYGLNSFFSLCLSSAEVEISKPDPAIFRMALEKAGCLPHQAVMIGDRIDNDVEPAKMLGFKTVRILQGPGRLQTPRNNSEEPDATVSNLAELMEIL